MSKIWGWSAKCLVILIKRLFQLSSTTECPLLSFNLCSRLFSWQMPNKNLSTLRSLSSSKIFSDCICDRMIWNLGELGIFGILKIPFNEWVVRNLFGIGLVTIASSPGIELVKLLNQEPHQRYLCYGDGVNENALILLSITYIKSSLFENIVWATASFLLGYGVRFLIDTSKQRPVTGDIPEGMSSRNFTDIVGCSALFNWHWLKKSWIPDPFSIVSLNSIYWTTKWKKGRCSHGEF